ncbi:hypothetical protein [Nonomuraea sp. 10N515B]|uniref:hypothetical protein n=1 Tax=Nonomuraea sp. 10N515B TaxID=3457422 RepID=UPI003FCCCF13
MDRYRVIAPYVIARTVTQDGVRMVGLGEGALVPDDVPAEWLAHHLRKKMIEKVASAEPPAPQTPATPPESTGEGEEADGPGLPAPPPPTGPGSSQKAWVDYAVARGLSREEAAAMSRDELIAALREG